MTSLLDQLKTRRLQLGLKQHDMLLRVGLSRQQYQHIESKGNPRLNTLERIAKGLNCEILFVPQEKLCAVKAILKDETADGPSAGPSGIGEKERWSDDPWKGLLGDDE